MLTGAGASTISRFANYRKREDEWKGRSLIQLDAFVNQMSKRKRYWASSMVDWPPGAQDLRHVACQRVTELEARGHMSASTTIGIDPADSPYLLIELVISYNEFSDLPPGRIPDTDQALPCCQQLLATSS